MVELKEVLSYLKNVGFILVNSIDSDNFYFDFGEIVISLTTPHSGNNFSYLIRADLKGEFDKWSNCRFEANFKNEEEMELSVSELADEF